MSARPSVLDPLRKGAFRWLWLGMLVSGLGMWAQSIGAQWLFINDPNAATIVSLVAGATALPAMIFALPAGVMSDAFDRRQLMIWMQVYSIIVSALLALLTWRGLVPPALLLGFTFAIGASMAMQFPTWQPLITELVPRDQISSATQLDMVNVNVSRAIGPAIAGLIITRWGVPPVFAFTALSTTVLLAALLMWRRPRAVLPAREQFLPALRAGGRYVRHEPVVRLLCGRVAMFIAPGSAMWALLALIANRGLGLNADGYGVLYAGLGLGAILGALTLGRLRRRMSGNVVLTASALAYAASMAGLVLVHSLLPAFPLLILAGYCWSAQLATLASELQLYLPNWVRARALAVYMMTFMGAQALASPVWGIIAQRAGVATAILVAAALVAASGLLGLWLRIPENRNLDRAPLAYWGDADLAVQPEPDAGPVQIVVEYTVTPDKVAGWLDAMDDVRRSRLRSGANRWEVYAVGERPGTYVEVFTVGTWGEHARQHDHRLTAQDQAAEDLAFSFCSAPPQTVHLVPPTSQVRGAES